MIYFFTRTRYQFYLCNISTYLPLSRKIIHYYHMDGWTLYDRIRLYIVLAGLYASLISSPRRSIMLSWLRVRAMAVGTHTFHILVCEGIITLQDVTVLFGLMAELSLALQRMIGEPLVMSYTFYELLDLMRLCPWLEIEAVVRSWCCRRRLIIGSRGLQAPFPHL